MTQENKETIIELCNDCIRDDVIKTTRFITVSGLEIVALLEQEYNLKLHSSETKGYDTTIELRGDEINAEITETTHYTLLEIWNKL